MESIQRDFMSTYLTENELLRPQKWKICRTSNTLKVSYADRYAYYLNFQFCFKTKLLVRIYFNGLTNPTKSIPSIKTKNFQIKTVYQLRACGISCGFPNTDLNQSTLKDFLFQVTGSKPALRTAHVWNSFDIVFPPQKFKNTA